MTGLPDVNGSRGVDHHQRDERGEHYHLAELGELAASEHPGEQSNETEDDGDVGDKHEATVAEAEEMAERIFGR